MGTTYPHTPPADTGTSPELLTITEAARHIRMSARHMRRLVAERRIPYHRLGRSIRFVRSDLDAYIAAGRVEPDPAGH